MQYGLNLMAKRKLKFNKRTEQGKFTSKPQPPKPKTMLMYPSGIADGCTAWRFDWVKTAMNYSKQAQVQMTNVSQALFTDSPKGGKIISQIYLQTDAVVLQRPVHPQMTKKVEHYNIVQRKIKENGRDPFRLIIDVDDVIHGDHIAKFNAARDGYADNKRFETFSEIVKRSDELHVCSKAMAEFYKEETGFERVLYRPNLMPKYLFDVFYNKDILQERYERHKSKPRVIWAGSATHVDIRNKDNGNDDFTKIEKFVKSTLDKYQWVFVGAAPNWLKSEVDSGKVEFYPWMSIMDYPKKIWDLEPTIIFAPLADNTFNICKSNIKLTEVGAMGIAGVFQDLEPYKEAPLKFNTGDELGDQFDYLLQSWENYAKVSDEMRSISQNYFLEDNFDLLKASYFTHWGSKERAAMSNKLIEIQ
jgi:hypothetical protein